MSDIIKNDFRIDRKFFAIKARTNSPKTRHLSWKDESKLSLKLVEDERVRRERLVCREIARIAEMEAKI